MFVAFCTTLRMHRLDPADPSPFELAMLADSVMSHLISIHCLVIFCIRRACRYAVWATFGNPANTLSNLTVCWFLVNLQVKLTSTPWFEIKCSLSLANGALELGVSIFRVNTSFGTPGGTREISSCPRPALVRITTCRWTRTSWRKNKRQSSRWP